MNQTSRISKIARITTLAVSVAATLAAGNAMAVQKYYGGGSTFAVPVYVGGDYLNETPEARLSTNAGNSAGVGFTKADITVGSAFAAFNKTYGLDTSYCQTGSGTGKNALNGAAAVPANGSCNDYSTTPSGMSAPSANLDFIGTDAPYSTTDYQNYENGPNVGRGGLVQVPTFSGAVALAHGDSIDNVALNTAQVCKIYSGMDTKWSQIAGVTGTGNKGAITIVYRTDSSGTTFSFTRYLAASCNGTPNVPVDFSFTPNSTFASAIPGGVAIYGTRSVGASGNPGVVGATLDPTNVNALGYADVGEVILEAAGYATVNGFDPTQFGASGPLVIPATHLLVGKVLDGATPDPVPGSFSTAVDNCTLLVDPSIKITNTYPIIAFTYLAGYYNGYGSTGRATGLKNLMSMFYNSAVRPALPQGFAYIDGNGTFHATVKNTIAACVNP